MSSTDWLNSENQAILSRREKCGVDTQDTQRWGLALSGGGIRSATFCLGVIKSLAKNGLLTRFDYLSTVSAASPAPEPFPPARPRLRKRWFADLLCEAAALHRVSSRNQSRPRMVKRRHSPYPGFVRPRPQSQARDYHPINAQSNAVNYV